MLLGQRTIQLSSKESLDQTVKDQSIDGSNAVTPTYLNYWNEPRGLIKIGGASTPSASVPKHIKIQGLELRNAYQASVFSGQFRA